ncbi:MAG: nucleotidyltransferase [Bacteroidales bacterium]|nr:nucleotidyltransferase [Bacteroidales bacterium]
MSIIDRNIDKIRDLCNRHKVAQLFAFGSVLTDNFNSDSDVDFVVDFSGVELLDYADNYFDLKFSLENLLKRDVDLLENKAIRNPFLRKSIDNSKQLIYG